MSENGKKADFFEEIIDSLRTSEAESPVAYVEKEVLLEFYHPARKQKPSPAFSAERSPQNPIFSAQTVQTVQTAPGVQTVQTVQTAQTAPGEPAVKEHFRQENILPPQQKEIPNSSMGKNTAEMQFPELAQEVSICSKCPLCRTRTNTVFGDGDIKASLMFIGEGPGAEEDAQGLPFVGKAGELLTKMIRAMGYTREEVYIGNIVKCRPPGNRTPEEEEIKACLPYIQRQIELIRPKAIVLLGATPLKGLFNMTGITRLRGKFLQYDDIPAMPTFHPAYLLRNPAAKADVWKDLQMVMKILGKEIPQRKNQ